MVADFQAKAAVKRSLIDPASAEFNILYRNDEAVCGTVNGRNRLGGYAGSTPFIWERSTGAVRIYEKVGREDLDLLRSGLGQEEFSERFGRLDAGCDFPEKWGARCQPGTSFDIPHDAEFCDAWRRQDKPALDLMRRY